MNDVKRKSNLKVIVWLLTLMLMFVGNVYYMTPTVKAETTVYVTKTGSKYHTHKCGNGVYYAATLSQATARGLTACEKCYGGSNGGTSAGGTSNSDSSNTAGEPPAVSENVVIKPIKISKTSIVLLKGKTSKLTIANATEEIIWESSKKSVAEVSSSGKVTAKKKGKAVITATVGNQKKTCQVTVEEPKLSKKNLTMNPGHTYKISLSGCKHSVKWSSGNSSVAKVSKGKITAKKPGKTTITAKVHNQKYKCVVKVNKPKVRNVSLGQTNVQLEYNKSIKLKVSAAPKNALKYYDISVKSSNENIVNASVGYDGASIILNAGENSGSCKVVVTVGNATTELKVNVIPPVISSISLNKTQMTLRPGGTGRLSVTVNPSEAVNYYDIEWKSSDTSVVKAEYDYGNYGEVTAVGEGEADVTVKIGTATATCHVVVAKPEITELTLNKAEMTLKPGGTGRLSVTVNPSEAVNYYDIEWKSSDTSVVKAEYDYGNYGEVIAVGEGEADVTVKIGTATATCHVVVAKPEITELTLNKAEMTLRPGGTGRLSVTVNPSEAVNYYDIEWKSSDTSVVKAEYDYGNYGEVTAVGEGEADVTVKIGTATATCHVVVIRPEITEVTLNKPEMTLKPGGTGRLSVTVNPSEE